MGWFRPVHAKSMGSQEVRALLVARKQLLGRLIDVELSIRGILRDFGLKVGVVTRKGFEGRIRELVTALGSAAYDAWTRARPANDFATMLPFLEKAVDLSRVRPTTPPPGESRASARLTKPSGFGLADESLRPNWFGW